MTAGSSLLLAVVVSLGLSSVLVVVLTGPLQKVLGTLCPTGEASRFWVALTGVMLFITPLLFSMMATEPRNGLAAAEVLRSTLIFSLLGAGLALTVVALKLAPAKPLPALGTPESRRTGGWVEAAN